MVDRIRYTIVSYKTMDYEWWVLRHEPSKTDKHFVLNGVMCYVPGNITIDDKLVLDAMESLDKIIEDENKEKRLHEARRIAYEARKTEQEMYDALAVFVFDDGQNYFDFDARTGVMRTFEQSDHQMSKEDARRLITRLKLYIGGDNE